jgi:glutamate racemase
MSDYSSPIGFFDSGVGGTSIWREVVSLLPHEDTIYLADSANAPYGRKSNREITALSIKNTELLLNRGCKLIAVPCNTATTNSIEYLRLHYDVPFIGIEPAIKPAALQSTSKKIGVLATQGTLSSALFYETSKQINAHVATIEVVGTGIVELIEAGKKDSNEMRELLYGITEPFMISGIDYLVLGCSHYPYIKELLAELLPSTITIIDSGAAVAIQTQHVLEARELLNTQTALGKHLLYSNKDSVVLDELTSTVPHRSVSYLNF